jgi:mannose-6-phosphate isomerase
MLLPRHFVEKPWGRTDLPVIFAGTTGRRIGEVWFDKPDEALPLLVKWLFTSERLSVQVHPNDAQARKVGVLHGKEECWFIVAAESGATVGIGTRRALSPEEFRDTSLSGEIERLIDWKPAKPGDFWFIPAGTVHAIGAGIKLVEIQQNSDMTYRLYDYGRPRELHLAESLSVSKPEPYTDARTGNWLQAAPGELMACEHFRIFKLAAKNVASLRDSAPVWVIPILGGATVNGMSVPPGACAYMPQGLASFVGEPALLAKAGHG